MARQPADPGKPELEPTGEAASPAAARTIPAARAGMRVGAILGVALMGALDEIIFHQLLQWHHFYVHATPYWRIFSDGLFHLFTASLWLLGALMLWRNRRRLAAVISGRPFWAGILLGAGAFQLFDGVVDHKLLGLHPVRLGVEALWPYDVAWIASALLLLAEGWVLWRSVGIQPGSA